MKKRPSVLLSFDVEEFDTPLHHGIQLSMDEQMKVGQEGLLNLLKVLTSCGSPPSTFYTTANFALTFPDTIKDISRQHEIASHAYYHSGFKTEHVKQSKDTLESIIGQRIYGYRMPNMGNFDKSLIGEAGYLYDSSIHPTWLPGRYNHVQYPIRAFRWNDFTELPASVVPYCRFPLFWLSFKNLPLGLYIKLCEITLNHTGFINLYLHPWEFADLTKYPIPSYIKNPNGEFLMNKFKLFIHHFQSKKIEFRKSIDYLQECIPDKMI